MSMSAHNYIINALCKTRNVHLYVYTTSFHCNNVLESLQCVTCISMNILFTDTFSITGAFGSGTPVICGANTVKT